LKLTHKLTHNGAVLLMVGVAFLWATAGVVTRHLEAAKSFEVTFWRSFATVLSLLAILPIFKGRDVFARVLHSGRTFWASGLCWSCMFTFYMLALTLTSVANVLVTLAIGPLVTALFARFFLGQRLPAYTWAAIVVAGGGIAWMFGSQVSGSAASGSTVLGMAVALVVPLAGAANWTLTQHAHAQGHDVDLMPAVLVGAVLSSLAMLPLAWPLKATAHDIALLGGLGFYQLAVPCALSVWCASRLKAPEVSLLALLEVPFGIALVWLGANEAPGTTVLQGGALVVGALAVNEALGWKRRG
jgi:drug/metabolite transporter (DMT)-like permease